MSAAQKSIANPDIAARRALGALRFVDVATGQAIVDGLSVIAHVRNKTIAATPASQGVHIFHQLPGLREVSFWDGQSEPRPEALTHEFTIEVRDTSRRFFPAAFKARFPCWPEATPICSDVLTMRIPLFSAPWRLPRNDLAIVRGTLQVSSTKKPAAWALLRAYRKDDSATPVSQGVAGPDGQFMLMFPWPKADIPALAGPKGPRWSVRIKASYDLPDARIRQDEYPDGEIRPPELCSILKQHPAKLLADTNMSELSDQEMFPGQTLFLETSGAGKFLLLDN